MADLQKGKLFNLFPRLPFEIREQIWLYSMQPRILCLHVESGFTPTAPEISYPIDTTRSLKIAFRSTAATTLPSIVFTALRFPHVEDGVADRDTGPAALYTCHESRDLALKRYQQAFQRLDIEIGPEFFHNEPKCLNAIRRPSYHDSWSGWSTRRMSGDKIWVDFSQDIIMIDSASFPEFPGLEENSETALHWLRLFAEDDLRKVQRLAIGGSRVEAHRGHVMDALRNFLYHLGKLDGVFLLEELLLDDTFDVVRMGDHIRYHDGFYWPTDREGKMQAIAADLQTQCEWSEKIFEAWAKVISGIKLVNNKYWKSYL